MLNSIVTYGIHFSWTRKKHEKPVFQNFVLRLIKDSEVFFTVGKERQFMVKISSYERPTLTSLLYR